MTFDINEIVISERVFMSLRARDNKIQKSLLWKLFQRKKRMNFKYLSYNLSNTLPKQPVSLNNDILNKQMRTSLHKKTLYRWWWRQKEGGANELATLIVCRACGKLLYVMCQNKFTINKCIVYETEGA